jgi:hypothetical protein
MPGGATFALSTLFVMSPYAPRNARAAADSARSGHHRDRDALKLPRLTPEAEVPEAHRWSPRDDDSGAGPAAAAGDAAIRRGRPPHNLPFQLNCQSPQLWLCP